jgi:hypothetical protein
MFLIRWLKLRFFFEVTVLLADADELGMVVSARREVVRSVLSEVSFFKSSTRVSAGCCISIPLIEFVHSNAMCD